ncbi:GDP-mannose 4,6-dehydratase [Lutibacter aestuarii]|uniref:GDP-mannose 4,6-dehydratase n=1 Tax=Lutibacter aestuarii TaxID=861111 RepID=A0ABW2Z4S7_9FLAO
MKYVITGGAGFIGSHIAEQLSNEGHEVIVLDNLRTGFENLFLDERLGDIKHSKSDPSKFNKLGFKPEYSIDQALEETINFYHKELINQTKKIY